MGLFSSKTKVYVASSVYNLAGDLTDRSDYMSSVAVNSAISNRPVSETIQMGILRGPGWNMKKFYKWANNNYTMGFPTADITHDMLANPAQVAPYIPRPPGGNIWVQSAFISDYDIQIWAEKYLVENHPELLTKEWEMDADSLTNLITISFEDDTPDITFMPTGFGPDGMIKSKFVIARYVVNFPERLRTERVTRTVADVRTLQGVGLTGYTQEGSPTRTTVAVPLRTRRTIRTSYLDGRAPTNHVEDTPRTDSFDRESTVWRKMEFIGQHPTIMGTYSIAHRKRLNTDYRILTEFDREIITTDDSIQTVSIERQYVEPVYSYTESSQEVIHQEYQLPRVFIYRKGSGNLALDQLETRVATQREFFPAFPYRIDNKFIDDPEWEEIYEPVSKAYKKAFGSKIDKLFDELKDNESIGDLDYIFGMFGVTLNEKDNACVKYIYEFLKGLIPYQRSSKLDYIGWANQTRETNRQTDEWKRWEKNSNRLGLLGSAAAVEPPRPQYVEPQESSFVLDHNIPELDNFQVTISWAYIDETLHVGKGRPRAKKGDCWISDRITDDVDRPVNFDDNWSEAYRNPDARGLIGHVMAAAALDERLTKIYIYHQYERLKFRVLEVRGLYYKNKVYGNKHVGVNAVEALEDADESGFIIPMHYPTLMKLNPREQNQISTLCRLLLLNSYKKVKIKWYQRGIFKIIIAIAIAVISIATLQPGGLAAAGGFLGGNVAIGTALGFAGVTAAVVGAIANAIAATLITTMISQGAAMVFGEKWGAIIGTIASFFAMQYGNSFNVDTNTFTMDWSKIMRMENLLNITNSVTRAATSMVYADINEMMQDYESMTDEYKEKIKDIQDKAAEILGQNAWINPMLLIDSDLNEAAKADYRESSESFLSRTLLTGSELADISLSMISEFADVSLRLPGYSY